jgi:hypothetical protein
MSGTPPISKRQRGSPDRLLQKTSNCHRLTNEDWAGEENIPPSGRLARPRIGHAGRAPAGERRIGVARADTRATDRGS